MLVGTGRGGTGTEGVGAAVGVASGEDAGGVLPHAEHEAIPIANNTVAINVLFILKIM